MKIVTIHQPEHLSYLGFFHKVSMAHTLVLLDNVQYEKNYFQNRNRIYTTSGVRYITVPVYDTREDINKIAIAPDFFKRTCRKNVITITDAYRKAPFWKTYGEDFLSLYQCGEPSLAQFNERLLRFILNALGIEVEILHASKLGVTGQKTELLLDILHKVDADKYIAGKSGEDYMDMSIVDVPVEFQRFTHPVYTQWGKDHFEPYMSIIDALFNVGPSIMDIIAAANGGRKTITSIQ